MYFWQYRLLLQKLFSVVLNKAYDVMYFYHAIYLYISSQTE